MPEKLLTAEEVAESIRLNVQTVRYYARVKKLKSYKMGRKLRFKAIDVGDFIERETTI